MLNAPESDGTAPLARALPGAQPDGIKSLIQNSSPFRSRILDRRQEFKLAALWSKHTFR
jgi:hypothetical protein